MRGSVGAELSAVQFPLSPVSDLALFLLAVAVVVNIATALDGDRILRRAGSLRGLCRSRRLGTGLRASVDMTAMSVANGVDHNDPIGSPTRNFNGFAGVKRKVLRTRRDSEWQDGESDSRCD